MHSSQKRPIFGYYRGKNENKTELWRIYSPNHKSKEPKFISNWKSVLIQGAKQLPKEGDLLVITKSMKDVMCLYSLGITAIAPNSENLFLTDTQYEKLKKRFKKIVLFYDSDYAGIKNMNRIRKQFNVDCIWIPRKYKAKDISDFYKMYGKDKTINLLKNAKEKIGIE
jgi:DNA primase